MGHYDTNRVMFQDPYLSSILIDLRVFYHQHHGSAVDLCVRFKPLSYDFDIWNDLLTTRLPNMLYCVRLRLRSRYVSMYGVRVSLRSYRKAALPQLQHCSAHNYCRGCLQRGGLDPHWITDIGGKRLSPPVDNAFGVCLVFVWCMGAFWGV